MSETIWALGLMSGTSLDGIDAALIKTNGRVVKEFGPSFTKPMDADLRQRIVDAINSTDSIDIKTLENDITYAHIEVVRKLINESGLKKRDIKVIGFHGQSISHRPHDKISWQMANGALMAHETGINTVCDFRSRDVAAGGEGAPLVPLYHAALMSKGELPIAIVNIGGLANVTWVGRSEAAAERLLSHDIIAFDTGPGNVLIDEWLRKTCNIPYDDNGEIAAKGVVHLSLVEKYMQDEYFAKYPPKSLDRGYFSFDAVSGLSPEDGAATLTEFTVESIIAAKKHFPAPPKKWLISGGGRLNGTIMKKLSERLNFCASIDSAGFEGDAIEAQAFAFLGVRAMYRLPLSLPTTTGAIRAVTGGAFYPA